MSRAGKTGRVQAFGHLWSPAGDDMCSKVMFVPLMALAKISTQVQHVLNCAAEMLYSLEANMIKQPAGQPIYEQLPQEPLEPPLAGAILGGTGSFKFSECGELKESRSKGPPLGEDGDRLSKHVPLFR